MHETNKDEARPNKATEVGRTEKTRERGECGREKGSRESVFSR